MSLRREVKEFTRCCDVLLNGLAVDTPLTEEERAMIEAYVERLDDKLPLRGMHIDKAVSENDCIESAMKTAPKLL